MKKDENLGSNMLTVPVQWFLVAFFLLVITVIYATSLENQVNTITACSVLRTKQLETEVELLKAELAEVTGPERVSIIDRSGGELDE